METYTVIDEYRVAIGGHKADKDMAWDGVPVYAIVSLNAGFIEGKLFWEDVVEYRKRIVKKVCCNGEEEEEEEDMNGIKMVPRLNIPIDDYDDENDPFTCIGDHFDRIVEFIDKYQSYNDSVVLFECYAGVSRSPTACCAYIMKDFRLTVDEALCSIMAERDVNPNPWFLKQLDNWEKELKRRFAEKKIDEIQGCVVNDVGNIDAVHL